ncbi:MAG: YraN family protein [Bacteroidota bacterium]|nr:YraN family protein [Bacteroidota bacterium]
MATRGDYRNLKGTKGEDLAAAYLERHGFVILERNYRFMKAEVDLIAFLPARDYEKDGDLVFVEVKWRRTA